MIWWNEEFGPGQDMFEGNHKKSSFKKETIFS